MRKPTPVKHIAQLRVGDKISGGRLDKYYAVVEYIAEDYIAICYNGDVRTVYIDKEDWHRVGVQS